MSATQGDVWKLLTYIQDDLRQTQAKLVQVRSLLAAGAMGREESDRGTCPRCGMPIPGGERAVAFHIQNVHDGPLVPLTPEEAIG